MRLKYVIIKDHLGTEQLLMCDLTVTHAYLAGNNKVISAGFVDIHNEDGFVNYDCSGESIGLKVKSRGEIDSNFIYDLEDSQGR